MGLKAQNRNAEPAYTASPGYFVLKPAPSRPYISYMEWNGARGRDVRENGAGHPCTGTVDNHRGAPAAAEPPDSTPARERLTRKKATRSHVPYRRCSAPLTFGPAPALLAPTPPVTSRGAYCAVCARRPLIGCLSHARRPGAGRRPSSGGGGLTAPVFMRVARIRRGGDAGGGGGVLRSRERPRDAVRRRKKCRPPQRSETTAPRGARANDRRPPNRPAALNPAAPERPLRHWGSGDHVVPPRRGAPRCRGDDTTSMYPLIPVLCWQLCHRSSLFW